jgi:hypothetical protein
VTGTTERPDAIAVGGAAAGALQAITDLLTDLQPELRDNRTIVVQGLQLWLLGIARRRVLRSGYRRRGTERRFNTKPEHIALQVRRIVRERAAADVQAQAHNTAIREQLERGAGAQDRRGRHRADQRARVEALWGGGDNQHRESAPS